MSLLNKLNNKSIEESIDLLCSAYEEKQASVTKQAKSEIMKALTDYYSSLSPETQQSIVGGLAGAGLGGLGMAGSNLIKNKKVTIRDLLYGALLGGGTGAAGGYALASLLKQKPATPAQVNAPAPSETPAPKSTEEENKKTVNKNREADIVARILKNPESVGPNRGKYTSQLKEVGSSQRPEDLIPELAEYDRLNVRGAEPLSETDHNTFVNLHKYLGFEGEPKGRFSNSEQLQESLKADAAATNARLMQEQFKANQAAAESAARSKSLYQGADPKVLDQIEEARKKFEAFNKQPKPLK